jgi:hypothetical protein
MNRKTLFFLALPLIATGCAPRYSSNASSSNYSSETKNLYTSDYVIDLVKVDSPTSDQGFIESNNVFKNKEIQVTWGPTASKFIFALENKSDKTQKIIWDEIVFIDSSGGSHKVIHEGVKLIDRNGPMQPTIVVKGSNIKDVIQPADYIQWHDGFYGRYASSPGRWDENPILPRSIYGGSSEKTGFVEKVNSQIGKKFKVLMTLAIDDKKKEYIFEFEVKSAKIK